MLRAGFYIESPLHCTRKGPREYPLGPRSLQSLRDIFIWNLQYRATPPGNSKIAEGFYLEFAIWSSSARKIKNVWGSLSWVVIIWNPGDGIAIGFCKPSKGIQGWDGYK